jgi:sodium/hydrogen antiporter
VKNVPFDIRNFLVAESAANDGLAYPFLSISIYLTTEASGGIAFAKWVVIGCFCTCIIRINTFPSNILNFSDQVILGTVLGAVIGMGFALTVTDSP